MPSLSEDALLSLEAPINAKEALSARPWAQVVLHSSYYKALDGALLPHFVRAFNLVDASRGLGLEMLRAYITLITKEGKDLTDCPNYRPISLLNVGLAPELPSLKHYGQVGFIPTREARDGVTRVLDLIHLAKTTSTPIMLLSTDADKGFNQVTWMRLWEG